MDDPVEMPIPAAQDDDINRFYEDLSTASIKPPKGKSFDELKNWLADQLDAIDKKVLWQKELTKDVLRETQLLRSEIKELANRSVQISAAPQIILPSVEEPEPIDITPHLRKVGNMTDEEIEQELEFIGKRAAVLRVTRSRRIREARESHDHQH